MYARADGIASSLESVVVCERNCFCSGYKTNRKITTTSVVILSASIHYNFSCGPTRGTPKGSHTRSVIKEPNPTMNASNTVIYMPSQYYGFEQGLRAKFVCWRRCQLESHIQAISTVGKTGYVTLLTHYLHFKRRSREQKSPKQLDAKPIQLDFVNQAPCKTNEAQ